MLALNGDAFDKGRTYSDTQAEILANIIINTPNNISMDGLRHSLQYRVFEIIDHLLKKPEYNTHYKILRFKREWEVEIGLKPTPTVELKSGTPSVESLWNIDAPAESSVSDSIIAEPSGTLETIDLWPSRRLI